jgi:hypothetical protein
VEGDASPGSPCGLRDGGDEGFEKCIADGAAFHSNQQWYNIKFKCDLAADHKKVVSFEFIVGDAVPRNEWTRHNLPAEGGSLD